MQLRGKIGKFRRSSCCLPGERGVKLTQITPVHCFRRRPQVSAPRLLEYYRELPQLQPPDDPDLWAARMHDALRLFRHRLLSHYTEGTLQRLLGHPDPESRRAAVLALGLVATMDSNAHLARALHDEDPTVARLAG